MENAASVLLRASQHPQKLRKALLYNGECFAPEDYNWQDICLCTQFWIVINAPECLSPWFLRVPEYVYLHVADTLFQPCSQLLIFITRFVEK